MARAVFIEEAARVQIRCRGRVRGRGHVAREATEAEVVARALATEGTMVEKEAAGMGENRRQKGIPKMRRRCAFGWPIKIVRE